MHNAWGIIKHSCRFPPFPYEYDVDIPFLTSMKANSIARKNSMSCTVIEFTRMCCSLP